MKGKPKKIVQKKLIQKKMEKLLFLLTQSLMEMILKLKRQKKIIKKMNLMI